jgi:hypothetical protein
MNTLPIGRRTGLADPYAPSTPLPLSKIMGEPRDMLTESIKVFQPAVVDFRRNNTKPLGAFERAFQLQPLRADVSTDDRLAIRQETVRLDRIARTRMAPTPILGVGAMNGWDWIRWGRRIKPNLPNGYLGAAAVVKPSAERGLQAQQLQMPLRAVDKLAIDAAAVGRAGVTGAPVSVSTVPQLVQEADAPTPKTPGNGFQLVYLVAAVAVVFLVLKAR